MLIKSTFLVFKKSSTTCPNWGEGGEVILDKIQKNSTISPGERPFRLYHCLLLLLQVNSYLKGTCPNGNMSMMGKYRRNAITFKENMM